MKDYQGWIYKYRYPMLRASLVATPNLPLDSGIPLNPIPGSGFFLITYSSIESG